jgi:hypothetical protein
MDVEAGVSAAAQPHLARASASRPAQQPAAGAQVHQAEARSTAGRKRRRRRAGGARIWDNTRGTWRDEAGFDSEEEEEAADSDADGGAQIAQAARLSCQSGGNSGPGGTRPPAATPPAVDDGVEDALPEHAQSGVSAIMAVIGDDSLTKQSASAGGGAAAHAPSPPTAPAAQPSADPAPPRLMSLRQTVVTSCGLERPSSPMHGAVHAAPHGGALLQPSRPREKGARRARRTSGAPAAAGGRRGSSAKFAPALTQRAAPRAATSRPKGASAGAPLAGADGAVTARPICGDAEGTPLMAQPLEPALRPAPLPRAKKGRKAGLVEAAGPHDAA